MFGIIVKRKGVMFAERVILSLKFKNKEEVMKLLKLLLVLAISVFGLINYRLFSFDKGISKTNMEDQTLTQALTTLTSIQKIEYYESPIKDGEYTHIVYIVTSEDAYLFKATQNEIDAFKFLGIFSSKMQPEKISPIPFYIEIILIIVILAVPFGRKKQS